MGMRDAAGLAAFESANDCRNTGLFGGITYSEQCLQLAVKYRMQANAAKAAGIGSEATRLYALSDEIYQCCQFFPPAPTEAPSAPPPPPGSGPLIPLRPGGVMTAVLRPSDFKFRLIG